ncbi:MAG: DUF268 domain-containing protein [Tannerella sp.]|jgi:SAM-dependent methyltransferase|nr:DUF268 domain-containing protein [Tannerella sp.]
MKLSLIKKKIRWTFDRYTYLYIGIHFFQGNFSVKNYWKLKKDRNVFLAQSKNSAIDFPITKLRPCYADSVDDAGSLSFHYFFQDLFVAQRIFFNNPLTHVDIGSRVDGFIAHIASFREIEVFDIRPLEIKIPNVVFKQLDIMDENNIEKGSVSSISCLHALEHFGLGRYGDPINFDGFLAGFSNIANLLRKGGKFYFSVPIGPQRVEFHAHRVFSLSFLLKMIVPYYHIDMFSYIDDQNHFYPDVELTENIIESNCICNYGCGIFELTRR